MDAVSRAHELHLRSRSCSGEPGAPRLGSTHRPLLQLLGGAARDSGILARQVIHFLRARLPSWAPSIADQGVVSLFNVLLIAGAGHLLGSAGLGTLALIQITMLAMITLQRTLILEPLLARGQAVAPTRPLRTLLWSGPLLAAPVTLSTAVVLEPGNATWWLLALVAPIWLLQDIGRYLSFASNSPKGALRSDIWLVAGFVVAALTLWATSLDNTFVVVGAWLTAAFTSLAASPAVRPWTTRGLAPEKGAIAYWRRELSSLANPLMVDTLSLLMGTQLLLWIVGLQSQRIEVAEVRAAMSALSPLAIVLAGLTVWLMPTLARSRTHSHAALEARASWGTAAAALPLAGLALILGPWLTETVFATRVERLDLALSGTSAVLIAITIPRATGLKVRGTYAGIARLKLLAAMAALLAMLAIPAVVSSTGLLIMIVAQNLVLGLALVFPRRAQRYIESAGTSPHQTSPAHGASPE